jgi:hypothetical protein
MQSHFKRAIAAASAAIIAVTAVAVTPASAASSPRTEAKAAQSTDISASRRYRNRAGNAAAIGAAAAIFGTIASIAAAQAYRDRHRHDYQPYYGPRAYGPYAYEPYPYYGPRW